MKIKETAADTNSLSVDMKRVHKKLSKSLEKFDDSVDNIVSVDDEQRKMKVQTISSLVYDVTEYLTDLNFIVDELIGDDLIHVDETTLENESELLEVFTVIIHKFELNLKNFHKTYYNKNIDDDLKLLSFNDFDRSYVSLKKNMKKIISNLDMLIQSLVDI
ncbi:MAG: hypothetical protein ACTSUE_17035 [Promethearchaeota archaeon]